MSVYKHISSVSAKATFSECGQFRYRLTIEKTSEQISKTVCVIMQNPSDADEVHADRTVQFLERLIFEKANPLFIGVKKLLIVNQFAYVQTNDFDGATKHIGVENDEYIESAINEAEIVLIAWGVTNKYKERQQKINSLLRRSPNKLLLVTKKHPSRGFYDDFVKPYFL